MPEIDTKITFAIIFTPNLCVFASKLARIAEKNPNNFWYNICFQCMWVNTLPSQNISNRRQNNFYNIVLVNLCAFATKLARMTEIDTKTTFGIIFAPSLCVFASKQARIAEIDPKRLVL